MRALANNEKTVVERVVVVQRFLDRFLGLMGRTRPGPGYGLLFPRCRCIHTCFMRFPLDLVFLDADNRVRRIVRAVRPWRMVTGPPSARSVLEIEHGWLSESAISEGDTIRFA